MTYKTEFNKQAYKLCLLGATDKKLADFFEVTEVTINEWKKKYPDFKRELQKGKDIADAEIGEALYERAKGYSHKEDKIFNHDGSPLIVPTIKHYPPDPTAIIFWLKNRQSDVWRDRRENINTELPYETWLKQQSEKHGLE